MKIVISVCHGGFNLSKRAVTRLAELNGQTAYFFKEEFGRGLSIIYVPTSLDSEEDLFWSAFVVPNPNEVLGRYDWKKMTDDQKQNYNDNYKKFHFSHRDIPRSDPKLIQVVGELGEAANGRFAELRIVEIPDGVEYEIEEYDGREWISEKHRTLS